MSDLQPIRETSLIIRDDGSAAVSFSDQSVLRFPPGTPWAQRDLAVKRHIETRPPVRDTGISIVRVDDLAFRCEIGGAK